MNIKKRILTLALCVIFMFSAVAFAAAEEITPEAQTVTVKVIDSIAGTLEVSGKAPSGAAGKVVTILVTNVDVNDAENNDFSDIEANIATRVQYQNVGVTKSGGNFSFKFMLNMDSAIADAEDASYTFDIYVGGEAYEGYEVATASYWVAATENKIAAAKAVLEAESAEAAGAIIETNKDVFVVDSAVYSALDEDDLAQLLRSKLAADLFAEYTAGSEAEFEDEYKQFEQAIRLCIAIEGFNQGITASLNGKTIVFDEALGLTDYIVANGTLNKLYTTTITDAGVKRVLNALFNKNVEDADALCKIFAKEILVQAIRSSKSIGGGVVANVITEENLTAAGYNVVSEYFNHTNKAAVNNDIYNHKNELTAENLEAKILASATKNYAPSDSSSNSGITGPSSSSNSGSLSVGIGATSEPAPVDPMPVITKAFTDIEGYTWAEEAILALADKGIINGVADKKFNPAGTLTREAAAKIICLAAGITPETSAVAFADVDANAWYAPYVAALNKAGIVNGVSETAFGVGKNVTREDFAVMICRALQYSATGENNFTDKAEISSYAVDAVSALYEKGIVNGYEDGSFKPKANISRAEGAKIIFGILSK